MVSVSRWLTALTILLPLGAIAAPLPIKDWIRPPEYRDAIISPTGKYLAVVMTRERSSMRYEVAVMTTNSVMAGKLHVTAKIRLAGYQLVGDVFWVSNNHLAAAGMQQFGGFDRPFLNGTLWLLDARGGHGGIISGNFGGLISTLPNEPGWILIESATAPEAYKIGVNNKHVGYHKVATSPANNGWLLADNDGNVRIALGYNTKTGKPELYYRRPGSLDWKDESSLLGSARAMASLETARPISFVADNNSLYLAAWSDNPAQTLGLYRINFSDNTKSLVYSNPIVDVGIGEFPVTEPYVLSFDQKSIVGARIMPGLPETRVFKSQDPRIQLLAMISKALPGSQLEITSWTQDGTHAVIKTWNDTKSVKYYLYSSKPKPSLTLLLQCTPWIAPSDLSPMKPITYRSRDGLTVHGYLTVPRGVEPKNLPLIVYVHGGPHGIRYQWGFNSADFDSIATEILANHGYAVLAPNYRGSGGYGFKFEEAGFRHWGDTMQNDLADAANWAVQQGIADPKRICILGASYGGYASLMSAERFPDLFRCAVGYDGVYDLSLQETRKALAGRNAAGQLYLKTVLGDNEKQLRAFSPVFNADTLKAAVMLLQGGEDKIAPVKGYDEMVTAIKRHGTPLETLYEPREGHGFYQPAHREKAWAEILAFLNQYIGPGVMSGSSSTKSN